MVARSGVPVIYRKFPDIEQVASWLPDGYRKLAAMLIQAMEAPQAMAIGGK